MRFHRDRNRNPDFFGVSLGAAALVAVGIAFTGWVNDKVVNPVIRPMLPGLAEPNNLEGQAIDAVTTAVAGVIAGEAVGLVDKPAGKMIRFGGVTFGVAKLIAAIVPDYSLSAKFPDIWSFSLRGSSAAPAQLQPGQAAPSGVVQPSSVAVGGGKGAF